MRPRYVALIVLALGGAHCDKKDISGSATVEPAATEESNQKAAEPKVTEKPKAPVVEPKPAEKPKAPPVEPKVAEKPKAPAVELKAAEKPKAPAVEPKAAEKPAPVKAAITIPKELDVAVAGVPALPAARGAADRKLLRKARIVRRKGVKLMRRKKYSKAAAKFIAALGRDAWSESRLDLIVAWALGSKTLEALQLLAQLRKADHPICRVWLHAAGADKRLAKLREDPRYKALMTGFVSPGLDTAKLWAALKHPEAALKAALAAKIPVYLAAGGRSRDLVDEASLAKVLKVLLKDRRRNYMVPTDELSCAGFCCRDKTRRALYDQWDMSDGGGPMVVLRKACWVPLPSGAVLNEIHVHRTWVPEHDQN